MRHEINGNAARDQETDAEVLTGFFVGKRTIIRRKVMNQEIGNHFTADSATLA